MKLHMIVGLLMSIALVIGNSGCSSDDGSESPSDVRAIIDNGWAHFESSEFSAALAFFNSALAQDAEHVEALTGAGWCLIRLDNPAQALENLQTAHTLNTTYSDASAGLGVALVLVNQFSEAVTPLAWLLTSSGDSYVFSHDVSVNSRDMRILYALASFHVGDLGTALAQVLLVDPTIVLDPTSPVYEADLLDAIESLMG